MMPKTAFTTTKYCPYKHSDCDLPEPSSTTISCFIAMPYKDEMLTTANTIIDVLRKHGIEYYIAREDVTAGQDILCKICRNIFYSDFGIIETTYANPNVMIEFGILLGKNKPVFLLLDERRTSSSKIPSDIVGLERIHYKNQETLSKSLTKGLEKFLQQIDFESKNLRNLIQQVKYYAQNGDLSSLDSALQIVFNRLVLKTDKQDQFVKLIQEIFETFRSKGSLELSLRFGLAGIRIYLMKSEKEKALKLYDQIMSDLIDYIASSLQNIIDIKPHIPEFFQTDSNPMYFLDCWTYWFDISDFNNPEVVSFYYSFLWYGLKHSKEPESWIKQFVDATSTTAPRDPIKWSDYHRYPWQGFLDTNYFSILWIMAIPQSSIESNSVLKIAEKTINMVREAFDTIFLSVFDGDGEWTDEMYRSTKQLKQILESGGDSS